MNKALEKKRMKVQSETVAILTILGTLPKDVARDHLDDLLFTVKDFLKRAKDDANYFAPPKPVKVPSVSAAMKAVEARGGTITARRVVAATARKLLNGEAYRLYADKRTSGRRIKIEMVENDNADELLVRGRKELKRYGFEVRDAKVMPWTGTWYNTKKGKTRPKYSNVLFYV